jgi:hypothetical protein
MLPDSISTTEFSQYTNEALLDLKYQMTHMYFEALIVIDSRGAYVALSEPWTGDFSVLPDPVSYTVRRRRIRLRRDILPTVTSKLEAISRERIRRGI